MGGSGKSLRSFSTGELTEKRGAAPAFYGYSLEVGVEARGA
jgi:hypothetical protein